MDCYRSTSIKIKKMKFRASDIQDLFFESQQ